MTAAALQQGPEVKRRSLIGAFRTARPRIVSIVAPAGFGKSTLARQFLAEAGGEFVVCDCAGLVQPGDFARRILAALADETVSVSRATPEKTTARSSAFLSSRTFPGQA